MARFPEREAEIVRLTRDVIAGLRTHADDFPSPPESPKRLEGALAGYQAAREAAQVAAAQAKLAFVAKREALAVLVDLVKSVLRYAENQVRRDHAKLTGLGWGGYRPRTPRSVPGQVMGLEIVREEESAVALAWKEPVDGGPVMAYVVERRTLARGRWKEVGTAVGLEITLEDQEPGVEFEYRVRAVNKAGKGAASGVVRVVL